MFQIFIIILVGILVLGFLAKHVFIPALKSILALCFLLSGLSPFALFIFLGIVITLFYDKAKRHKGSKTPGKGKSFSL